MKKVDFLFVYDVKNREYDNLCLLSCELRRRGYTVGYQSFWYCTTHLNYPHYQPKVAAVATCYKDAVYRTFTSFAGQFEKVVNLQWEQIPRTGSWKGVGTGVGRSRVEFQRCFTAQCALYFMGEKKPGAAGRNRWGWNQKISAWQGM